MYNCERWLIYATNCESWPLVRRENEQLIDFINRVIPRRSARVRLLTLSPFFWSLSVSHSLSSCFVSFFSLFEFTLCIMFTSVFRTVMPCNTFHSLFCEWRDAAELSKSREWRISGGHFRHRNRCLLNISQVVSAPIRKGSYKRRWDKPSYWKLNHCTFRVLLSLHIFDLFLESLPTIGIQIMDHLVDKCDNIPVSFKGIASSIVSRMYKKKSR